MSEQKFNRQTFFLGSLTLLGSASAILHLFRSPHDGRRIASGNQPRSARVQAETRAVPQSREHS